MLSSVRVVGGVSQLDLFPMHLEAVLAPLAAHAHPWLVLSGLDFLAWDGPRFDRSPLHLARGTGIVHHRHPEREDVMAIRREDLERLLAAMHHWNFHCWDAPKPPRPSALARQASAIGNISRWKPGTAALGQLDGARVFIDSHDDAYLTVEARDEGFTRGVFAHALQEVVGGVVQGREVRPDPIGDVPPQVVEHFWSALPSCEFRVLDVVSTGDEPAARVTRVRLGFAPRETGARFGMPNFLPTGHLVYDARTGGWALRYS